MISIVLPLSYEIIESNKEIKMPSKKWILMGCFAKDFISDLSNYIVHILKEKGYNVVDPSSQEFFLRLSLMIMLIQIGLKNILLIHVD